MKIVWLVLLVLFCMLHPYPVLCKAADLSDVEELEAFLDGVMASQFHSQKISGATLSIVKDGEIILSKGYGFSHLKERIPVDAEKSLFRPGSVSKLLTWTAIMQLVEKGMVDLDTDINTYLDLEIPDTLFGSKNKVDPITLKHLLTHTPGFEDRGEGLFEIEEERLMTLYEYLKSYLPARVFPPGEVMAYSNYGSALAGYIVERASGQPFAQYVEENIFQPLGMEKSTFRQPLPDHLTHYMTKAYKFHQGEYYQGDFEFISAYPAGALSTTATDMARFMIGHLGEGGFYENGILTKETLEEMHRQQFTHHPQIPGMTYGFIETLYNKERVLSHGGATLLFFSGLYLLKDHHLGFFVSYSSGTGMETNEIFQAFMDRYFPSEYPTLPKPNPIDAKESIQYIGEYHPSRSNFTSFEKVLGIFQRISVSINEDGYLVVTIFGEPALFGKIEPGLYQNSDSQGLVKRIAFTRGPRDAIFLLPGGPNIYQHIPWYGSSMVLFGVILFVFFMMLGTALGWTMAFFRRKIRGEYTMSPFGAKLARLTVLVFTLFLIFFLFGFIGIFSSIHPAYGVPEIVFGQAPPLLDLLVIIPYLLAFLGILMLVSLFFSWWKRYWTLGSRLHYFLITLSAMGFLWVLYYMKFLSFFPG